MEKSGGPSGRTNMRSRSPLFVIALLVLCGFLAFNYWSLSSRNGELSNELESLQLDFRAISDKHTSSEKHSEDLVKQLEEKKKLLMQVQTQAGEAQQKLTETSSEINSLKEQLKKAQEATDASKKELESVKQEKATVSGELENVKKQLTEAQNAPKVCDKEACKAPLREVLTALTKTIGKPPVSGALKQHNVDMMSIAGDLLEGAEPAKEQPGQQNEQEKKDTQEKKEAEKKSEGTQTGEKKE